MNKYFPIIIALTIGIALGVGLESALVPQPIQLNLASAAEKENARQDIARMYLTNNGSINCTDPTDPIKPQDRTSVFNKYLQVNGYVNRAVVRGCNNVDQLLAKTKNGEWVMTNVNVNLRCSC